MKSLIEYAQKVSETKNIDDARKIIMEMIDSFDHKDKANQMKENYLKVKDLKKMQKFAWDIVLRGENLQVMK